MLILAFFSFLIFTIAESDKDYGLTATTKISSRLLRLIQKAKKTCPLKDWQEKQQKTKTKVHFTKQVQFPSNFVLLLQ
jgi:hypothetical protein